ncbi:MAG: NTP transferase domain-containing protein [Chitinophagaceae bacterium]|nr:NTP transferase domain-containing protein [Chitinophagaceae bacterium]
MQAMIFAAGLGTRFKPWTDNHPKALALVNGKSLLQRNINYLQRFGIKDIVVNIHHFPDQLKKAIEENKGWGSNVIISDEGNEILETGGGLKKAIPLLHASQIVLMNADILTDLDLKSMEKFHQHSAAIASIAVTDRKTSRYFLFDKNSVLCGWRNSTSGEERISREGSNLVPKAFSGIHIINKELLSLLHWPGKIGIVDVYLELAKTHMIKAFDHSGGLLIDVGKPDSVGEAERMFE